jgi:hypothetical protein
MATDFTSSAMMRWLKPFTALSSSFTRTEPSAASRSAISKRSVRGASGTGRSIMRS